jgi:pyruvate dehydrogenase E2 component (dihydrolipoamide acetyltransferase)
MALDLRVPLLGDIMQEGTLVEWLRADGARVEKGEPLYRLETDKVTVDVEAPAAGTLRHLARPGEVIPVGTVLGRLIGDGEPVGDATPPRAEPPSASTTPPGSAPAESASAPASEVRATPAARRLARDLGVDLAALAAASRGRIREEDVRAYSATRGSGSAVASTPTPPAPAAADGARRGVALSGRRRVIAQRMHQSLQEMAQLTIAQEIDVSECEGLRAQLQQLWGAECPSYTALVVRAASLALREHPHVNATWEQDRLVLEPEINVGLAVDAPEGLIVPVLRGADGLGLRELAQQTRAVADRVRANQVRPEELHGGTFSVTTLGALGIHFFTPIVNPPQVAVLGIGCVFSKLALVGDRVVERSAMYLSLSFDHRALDGAPAARFLNRVKSLLELPIALL